MSLRPAPRHVVALLLAAFICGASLASFLPTPGLAQVASRRWLNDDGSPTASARLALEILEHAAEDGLLPEDYGYARLTALGRRIVEQRRPADAIAFDAALSEGFVLYLQHLRHGRTDLTGGFGEGVGMDIDRRLHDALSSDGLAELVFAMTPSRMHYRELRTALRRYRALAATTGPQWDVTAFPATVHPGDRTSGLPALHRLLVALGDLREEGPTPAADAEYVEPLVSAVRRFQARHGLDADGVIGKMTKDALGVPLDARVRQIELALERIRGLGDAGDQRTIVLNVPMFQVWAWDAGAAASRPALSMRAVVGAVRTPTPLLEAEIRRVIFRPYWNVPTSILRGELLPLIRSDATYLHSHDMEIVRDAGAAPQTVSIAPEAIEQLRAGLLRVRQRPGPRNALGLVKLQIESEAGVHLHGTPQQNLFARSRRDFSHGCIRLEDPVAMAQWALDDPIAWSREQVLAATTGADAREIPLADPVRVSLFYATAGFDAENDTVRFAEDIYGLDRSLERAIEEARKRAPQ